MSETRHSWTVLAHLLRPQGRKGELLAELLTDFPERFKHQTRVFLAPPGFQGELTETSAAEIINFWLPLGKNQGRIVLQFAGIGSISNAELLTGLEVIIPREERQSLEEDAVYISELIGCTLYDASALVGQVVDVQFAMTPDGGRRLSDAAPLLAVTSPEGDEILIPFARAFLVSMDIQERRIDMNLPEGLADLNRTSAKNSDQK